MQMNQVVKSVVDSIHTAKRFDDPSKLTFDRFPYARLMTVEIEAEPSDDSSKQAVVDLARRLGERDWDIKRDPSLSKRGLEFISPTTAGDTLDEEIRFAVDSMKDAGFDMTPWASIHVHVDVRDLNQKAIGGIILLSGLNQDHLYQVCPRYRYNSPFCQPFPRAFLDALEDRIREPDDEGINDVWERHLGATMTQDWAAYHKPSRWYGVCYRPYRSQGSLEWRMFNDESLDADSIINWCEVIHQLVDRGASSDIDDICQRMGWSEFFRSLKLRPHVYRDMLDRRRRHWLTSRVKPVDYTNLPTVQVQGSGNAATL